MTTEVSRRISPVRIAQILAVIGTLLAVYLHVVFAMHAGALWRDEVNSLELATVRTFSELWTNLDYDSFPVLFFFVLRTFATLVAQPSDGVLRIFGVTIGLLILGATWLNARLFSYRFPLISLALIGFNPMVIRYGDSIRAYGLGILLMLLTVGAIWKVVESPTPRRILLASLAALLSVQCLYYNALLVFALCLGGIAVTLRRRKLRQAGVMIAIGAISAASLLPYLVIIQRVRAWNFQFKAPIDFKFLTRKAMETFGSPIEVGAWVVAILFILSLCVGLSILLDKSENEDVIWKDRALFVLVTLLVGTVAYASFLKMLSYVTQPWYYVLFVAFVATCMDILFALQPWKTWMLLGRSAFALGCIGMTVLPAQQALETRQTNVDLIARRLESIANKNDLILINTWNYAIPFRRYYHGGVLCLTIPPVEDLRFHRCDIVKRQMMTPSPIDPVLKKVGQTLAAGNKVWLVGALRFLAPGEHPATPAPGYDGPQGWVGDNFYEAWSEQTGFFLQTHADKMERVLVSCNEPVSHYENLPLSVFQNWSAKVAVSTPIP
jgi:uncharacterized membrane protein